MTSSALVGRTLTLSASQGAATGGPLTVTSWGGPVDAGPIAIFTQRTVLQCAPDAVYFDVDLSGATFDAAPAATADDYDPQFHDLDYYWTFGDPGTFNVPLNLREEWKNRNFAYGKKPGHCFTAPGDYTVTLLVVEPATGKTATAETVITVADPDVVYAGDLTVCVYPAGGSPGTTPSGALLLESDSFRSTDAGHAALVGWVANGVGRRILFQRGGTYTVGVAMSTATRDNLMFGAYGSGARPVLNPVTDKSVGGGNNCFYYQTKDNQTDLRFQSLDCVGSFDAAKGDMLLSGNHDVNTVSGNCIRCLTNLRYVIHDMRAAGFGNSTFIIQPKLTTEYSFMMFDSLATDFGGEFATFFSQNTHPRSRFSYAGVSIVQKPDAVSDEKNFRASIRVQHIQSAHFRGCDFFHRDHSQPCIKIMETPQKDGADFHIHTSQFEGNLEPIAVNRNIASVSGAAIRSYLINGIVENVIALGTMRTTQMMTIRAGGITVRNNLFICPAVPNFINQFQQFCLVTESDTGTGATPSQPPSPAAYGGPIKIYNNTCVMLRDTVQNTNFGNFFMPQVVSQLTPAGVTPMTVIEENNVLHVPNVDEPSTAFAPLDTTPLGWQARNPGLRIPYDAYTGTFAEAVPSGGTFTVTVPDSSVYSAVRKLTVISDRAATIVATTPTSVTIRNDSAQQFAAGWGYTLWLHFTPAAMPPDDAAFATPADTIASYAPLDGSAAIGAALSGLVAHRDLPGQQRPMYASVGAWEMSGN